MSDTVVYEQLAEQFRQEAGASDNGSDLAARVEELERENELLKELAEVREREIAELKASVRVLFSEFRTLNQFAAEQARLTRQQWSYQELGCGPQEFSSLELDAARAAGRQ